jgi:hypothetical protein
MAEDYSIHFRKKSILCRVVFKRGDFIFTGRLLVRCSNKARLMMRASLTATAKSRTEDGRHETNRGGVTMPGLRKTPSTGSRRTCAQLIYLAFIFSTC